MDYKTFAIDLAYKAGEIMRKNFSLGMRKEWKENNTPLTISDTLINKIVIESVKKQFPGHAVVGEEESFLQVSDYVWLCDPIDGTIPFSHGIPVSTFSLALAHKGVPIFGVVYDPYMDRLFVGEKDKGAYLNNKLINVSSKSTLKNAVLNVEGKSISEQSAFVKNELLKKGVKIVSLASFAYCGVLVAAGEFSASIFFPDNPWDVAAVKVIVEEAGGKCTDLQGNDQYYDKKTNGFIASNGPVHAELVELIKQSINT